MTIAPIRFHSRGREARATSDAGAARPRTCVCARAAFGCCAERDRWPASSRFLPSTYWTRPKRHADAGAREAEVPVDALREVAGDERPEERAEVDPHVEDREAGVAARSSPGA